MTVLLAERGPGVARKRADRKKATARKAGRPQSAGEVREHVLGIRGTAAWKSWVVELAMHCRLDLADLVDQSLADFAKAKGFDKVPPKR